MEIAVKVTQEMIDDVREQLKAVYEITREDHGPRRMTFHVMPKLSVSSRKLLEAEGEIIKKYCNPPFTMYSDTSMYRFTLTCN